MERFAKSYILKQIFLIYGKIRQILYIKATMCLSVWAMLRKFFQSLPVPCGVSPYVTSQIWLQRKKKSGAVWFFETKDLVDQKKYI
jgi:hypothetical protein